jgi:hypothetical protein
MRVHPLGLAILIALTVSSGAWAGHHELAAQYDRGRTITLTGRVTSIEWVNPHVVVTLAIEKEARQTWRFELDQPAALGRRGWTRDQITVGESIIVTTHPAKDGGPTGVARTVTLPSGQQLVATTDASWNWRRMPSR